MRTSFLAVALLLLPACPLPGFGQTAPAPADTARSYKHHLGLTASPHLDHFFTANQSLPIGLLYRQQTRPNRAWRVRIAGQSRYFKQEAPLFIGTAYTERTVKLEAAVGPEWWFALGRRVTLFAGVEVGGRYERYRRDSKDYEVGLLVQGVGLPPNYRTTGVVDDELTNIAAGALVQPIAGIRYFFNSRFSTEIEAIAGINWARREFKLSGTYYDLDTGNTIGRGDEGHNIYYTLTTSLRPINSLRLFFLF